MRGDNDEGGGEFGDGGSDLIEGRRCVQHSEKGDENAFSEVF